MTDGRISPMDWVRSVGTGILAGAVFVAVAMVVENKAIKAGAKLFGR